MKIQIRKRFVEIAICATVVFTIPACGFLFGKFDPEACPQACNEATETCKERCGRDTGRQPGTEELRQTLCLKRCDQNDTKCHRSCPE